ncbi:MAG: hypothetical protein J5781_04210 [Clostridia bacterium]|nr:hypothetical protein [Clostridia bacterium]
MPDNNKKYRKGVMLGLTLAEIMILFLFLLLTILSILWQRQKKIAEDISSETYLYRTAVNQNDNDPKRMKLIQDIAETAPIIVDEYLKSTYKIAPLEILGEIDEGSRLIVNDDGFAVGYVGPDNKIKDFDGDELGKINDEGIPIDDAGNTIGKIAEDKKIVVNKKGNPIGYADKNGHVVSTKGDTIGQIDDEGVIRKVPDEEYSPDGVIIGYFDGTTARDFSGNILGNMNGERKIVDSTGTVAGGLVLPGNVVKNPSGTVVGYVTALNRVKGKDAKTIAVVDDAGNAFLTNSEVVATIEDCASVAFNSFGKPVGYLKKDNVVADFHHAPLGVAGYTGSVLDSKNKWEGHLGRRVIWVKTAFGKYSGFITETGQFYSERGERMSASDEKKLFDFFPKDVNLVRLIRDESRRVIGYLQNGVIKTKNDGNLFLKDELVIDKKSKVVGHVAEIVSLGKKEGEIVGYAALNGHFFDFNGKEIGIVDRSGTVLSSKMRMIGSIGTAYRTKKQSVVFPDEIEEGMDVLEQVSLVTDDQGDAIGRVDDNDAFYDLKGERQGFSNIFGAVEKNVFSADGKSKKSIIGHLADKAPLIEARHQNSDIIRFMKEAIQTMDIVGRNTENDSEQMILKYQNRARELEKKITDLEGWKSRQIMQMEQLNSDRRKAGEKPIGRDKAPCWARKDDKGNYVDEDSYHIEIRDNGVIIRDISPEHRKKDFAELPPVPLGKLLSFEKFKKETLAIFNWEKEKKNDCRFRVKICQNTKDDGAVLKTLDVINIRFYMSIRRDFCDYVKQ